jgi:hypothetical protein
MKSLAHLFSTFFAFNIVFSFFIFSWATDEDIEGLSLKPLDRFSEIFLMNISTFTLAGCTHRLKSKKIQFIMSLYMLFIFSALIRHFF